MNKFTYYIRAPKFDQNAAVLPFTSKILFCKGGTVETTTPAVSTAASTISNILSTATSTTSNILSTATSPRPTTTGSTSSSCGTQKKVVCYFPNWTLWRQG